MTKLAKDQVDYSIGKPSAHCGLCAHFLAPDHCEIVYGQVKPNMWCRRFLSRKESRTRRRDAHLNNVSGRAEK